MIEIAATCACGICTPYKRVALILMMIAVAVGPLMAKRKDDVVVMKNGDRLSGEIKGLQHGELSFKSEYMADAVRLNWDKVERIESQDIFIVALTDGRRVTGLIERVGDKGVSGGEVRIVADHSAVTVKQPEVVGIQQRDTSFWNQLTGSIDYGFSFTGDNSQTTSSLSADVAYYARADAVELSTSSQLNRQSTGPNTSRYTFTGQYTRKLTPEWLAVGIFDLLRSDQQNLNLRTIYGGGVGRILARTDKTSLVALGGLVYTHESYFPQPGIEPVRNNAESLFGLGFSTFRFRTLDINSETRIFPSLSDPGRMRLSTQSDLRIELVRNLYWDFRLYENFDSRPPVNAPRNDLGITTALGWKF
jgi:putative salt-induced outer membrane protein YdiY